MKGETKWRVLSVDREGPEANGFVSFHYTLETPHNGNKFVVSIGGHENSEAQHFVQALLAAAHHTSLLIGGPGIEGARTIPTETAH